MSVAPKKITKGDIGVPKAIRFGPDKDRVRNATIRAAEEIISPAPSWLSDVLADQSFQLVSAHSIEEIWPKRQEMWEELREIHRLADVLDRRLQNSAVTGFMEINSGADLPKLLSDTAQNIKELRSRIRQSLKSPELVDKNGKLLSLLQNY